MCISLNDLLYFISQGLTMSGLVIASISGLKTNNREIIESVYKLPNTPETKFKDGELIISPDDIREQNIEESIREKVKFVFCFIFAFIGIIIDVVFNIDAPTELTKRIIGVVFSSLFFSFICREANYVYVKYKKKKIVNDIMKGFVLPIQDGDISIN